MMSPETCVEIRRYFYAEHWKIGTIARELGIHPDAVRHAIGSDHFHRGRPLRPSITDPYLEFVRQTLDRHLRLRATRIYQMICERGYAGSVVQVRRAVARLRPPVREPFLRLHTFPAEQAQVDWAHFGQVAVGRARRTLSCFVITLSYSRALYGEFFFDQTMENFLRGHVHAFQAGGGQPRVILSDNLRSAVLERRGSEIHFHPRLMELCAHYHLVARPCQVRAGNQKGRVERAIRYVRDSFWAGRSFTTLAECNRQALVWRDQVAHQRRWPGDDSHTVEQAFAEEQPRLLPHPSQTAQLLKLLDLYGPAALRRAIREALDRNTPRASSVAFLLRRQQRSASSPAPLMIDLSRHPEAQAIEVRPHDLETYDELANSDHDPDQ